MIKKISLELNADKSVRLKEDTIRVIRSLKFTPVPFFGQNFVVDEDLIECLIDIAMISHGDRILEIGGGIGTLTSRIARSKASITYTIEADRKLSSYLKKCFANTKNVRVIGGDFLDIDLNFTSFNKIVSNPPFHISTDILRKLIQYNFDSATLTFQKDFVQKMISSPSTSNYSKISVLSRLFFNIRAIREFPSYSFFPSPNTIISLISLKLKAERPKISLGFWEFLTFAFTYRNRKFKNVIFEFQRTKGLDHIESSFNFRDDKVFQISPELFLTSFNSFNKS